MIIVEIEPMMWWHFSWQRTQKVYFNIVITIFLADNLIMLVKMDGESNGKKEKRISLLFIEYLWMMLLYMYIFNKGWVNQLVVPKGDVSFIEKFEFKWKYYWLRCHWNLWFCSLWIENFVSVLFTPSEAQWFFFRRIGKHCERKIRTPKKYLGLWHWLCEIISKKF